MINTNARRKVRQITSDLAIYIDLRFATYEGTIIERTKCINADPFVKQKRNELKKLHFYDGMHEIVNGEGLLKVTKNDVADLIREGLNLRELGEICNAYPSKMLQIMKRDADLQTLWQTRVAIRQEVVCKFDDGRIQRYKSAKACAKSLGLTASTVHKYLDHTYQTHCFQIWAEKDYLQMLEDKYSQRAMVGGHDV